MKTKDIKTLINLKKQFSETIERRYKYLDELDDDFDWCDEVNDYWDLKTEIDEYRIQQIKTIKEYKRLYNDFLDRYLKIENAFIKELNK